MDDLSDDKRHPETPTVRARIHVGEDAIGGDDSPQAQVVKVCKGCMRSLARDADVCPECGEEPVSIRRVPDVYLDAVVGGKYRIVEKVGQGGMGEVYRARNDALGQNVAVKFLSKKFAGDENLVARFLNEAKSYCRVNHPNAVTLLDYGQHDDAALFIITEFIEGKNVTETLRDTGPLDAETVRDVGMQIAEVLSAAHGQGVIHRDLKPDNIMLMPLSRGRYAVKVLDFGIAKIVDEEDGPNTETGSVFGTPEFMSPEQARGDDADGRSDMYALGVILFYMLTGKLPFRGKNKLVVLNMQVNDPPPRPRDVYPNTDVAPQFEALIMKCLAKDRAQRYTTADDLLEAFEALAEVGGIAASRRKNGATPTLGDGWSALDGEADTLASLETPRNSAGWDIDAVEMSHEQRTDAPQRGQRGRMLVGVGAFVTFVLFLGAAAWWSAATQSAPIEPTPEPTVEAAIPTPVEVAAPAPIDQAPAVPEQLPTPEQQPVPETQPEQVVAPTPAEVAPEPAPTEPAPTEVAPEPAPTPEVVEEPAELPEPTPEVVPVPDPPAVGEERREHEDEEAAPAEKPSETNGPAPAEEEEEIPDEMALPPLSVEE